MLSPTQATSVVAPRSTSMASGDVPGAMLRLLAIMSRSPSSIELTCLLGQLNLRAAHGERTEPQGAMLGR